MTCNETLTLTAIPMAKTVYYKGHYIEHTAGI